MTTLRRILLLTLTLLPAAIPAGAQTPTVKDVMLDKAGKYIYAQAIYTDADTAGLQAREQLLDKIMTFCADNKLKAPHPDAATFVADVVARGYAREITSAVCDRTRCFVYITTEALMRQDYLTPTGNARPAAPQPKPQPQPQSKAKPQPQPQPQSKPQPASKPQPKPAPKPDPTPSVNITPSTDRTGLPEGRIGDIIDELLKQTSTAEVLSVLEKGKNSMALSRYGNKETKFIRHCYIITLVNNTLHVYSPQSYEGARTDYVGGGNVTEPEGTLLFWFLKK